MEGRCVVDTWAELVFSGASKLEFAVGTDAAFCAGSDEVHVFNTRERKLLAVLQFPAPVSDLAGSHDGQLLYVSCRNGVHCVSVPELLSRCSPDPSSSLAEVRISSEFLVVAEEGASSLLLVGSVLLILLQRDASWLLGLYKTPKQSQSGSCEMLGWFSLPLVPADLHGGSEEKTGVRWRPVLTCVHSGHTTPPSSSSSSSTEATLPARHFFLEPVLFKLLFGIDAGLAKSPVVLCGLPDGRLCCLPLRLPGSQLRVLYSLEQPVVCVGASDVEETGPGFAQCLVAMGEKGGVVLIKMDKRGPEGSAAVFSERCVPGPVVCGCVGQRHLYYSSGSDLLVLDLSEEPPGGRRQGSDEETLRKSTAALQTPASLNVCRVVGLAGPSHSAAGEVQLLVLTARGQLQKITLPPRTEDATLSKLPSTQADRSVKDLLSAIGDVCERVSVLKASIKSRNQILSRLNQVLSISFALADSKNGEGHLLIQEKPIRCHAMTRWSRLLQKDSLNLTCVLDNSSPYALERGWTLSITVFPLSCSPNAGGQSSSTNFSLPFHNLHPGETFEVSLPLAAAGDASFPMTVTCSLIFSLRSLLDEEELVNLTGLRSSCITLPVNTLTVDWLHTLQVNCPTASRKNVTSQFTSVGTDAVQAFLISRWMRGSGRAEERGESVSTAEPELCSASVRVSSQLLRDTLVKSSELDPQEQKLASQNLCISLLEWMLSEAHGGVKMGHQGDEIALSSSVVHARGPNGETVKLTAREVKVGEESLGNEELLSTVELRAESSSLAAVCGLHHAVLHRVQTLLQRAPERAASTERIQSLGLRQALQRAERLLQQIQRSRVSEAFGEGVSTGQMTQSLLSVYRELRENPFIII